MLAEVIKRELRQLTSRPIWITGIMIVPLAMLLFFMTLLGEGLPTRVPAAIVDLDHTTTSRQVTRSLNAMELVDISSHCNSFAEAMELVQSGKVYGFFVIPDGFEADAKGGRQTSLTFYCNLTYYVPGTLVYKGFKTLAVTTSGRLVSTELISLGATPKTAGTFLQPMTIENHPIGNPWLNYSYYLSTSFLPGLLQLMVMIMAAYAMTHEIKMKTSRMWLRTAGENIYTAVIGKLLPQTVAFIIIGLAIDAVMFGYLHFPMHCSWWVLITSMVLLVVASQALAVIVVSIIPNMRLSLSVCSLIGILSFSLAAFSYPMEAMYGWLAIFSYILPVRWYFLIYGDAVLNGYPLYFERMYYVWLMVFPALALLVMPLMRKALKRDVYIP